MKKTVLSFYLDDTNPYVAPPSAFGTFLETCEAAGVRGESTILLGFEASEQGLLSRPATPTQHEYIELLHRAPQCGIEANMELMTHGELFDFAHLRPVEGGMHEGLWLHEPGVSLDEYESYFTHIVEEGERIGVRFAGATWPGCGCPPCEARYAELRQGESTTVNPKVWEALLSLAKQGRFASPAVTCFTLNPQDSTPHLMAAADGCSVWDLRPNAADMLGSWSKTLDRVSADYYINAEGTAGRIVELVQAGAPHGLFYAHWQGMNPENGIGWSAFLQVIDRVQQHLRDKIEWLTPSEYARRLPTG